MVVYESLPTPLFGGGGGGGSNITDGDTSISITDTGSNGSINIITNNQNAMTLTASQKVGINTTLPSKRLDVNDPFGECLRLIYDDNLGRNIRYTDFIIDPNGNLQIIPYNGSIKIPANINGNGLIIGNTLVTASGNQINTLTITMNGIAESNKVLVLDSSRNIENINNITCTNLISSELTGELQTGDQPNITSLGQLTGLFTDSAMIGISGSYLNIYGESNILYVQPFITDFVGSACDLFIGNYLRSSTNSIRKVMIKADGKIGFGTSSPNKMLEIYSIDGNCLRLTNNSNFTDINILPDGTMNILNTKTILNHTSNSNVIGYPLLLKRNISIPSIGVGSGMQFNINDDEYGRISITTESTIDKNGLLSIGLSNNSVISNVFQLNSYGTLRVQNLTELSDERSKENITQCDNTELFEKIMGIQIKKFNMINDKSECVGVIAQQLKEIMPNSVDVFEFNNIKDYHCIKTKEILFSLIGAFQHLVEELKLKNII